jgi:hypothetical protein
MSPGQAADHLWTRLAGFGRGTPGEPFPRDLKVKANAEAVLRTLSRMSPAADLYSVIKADAEHGIEHARRERETFGG